MSIWALIPLITCITYVLLLIVTMPSIGRRENRVFALYLAAAAIWSFTSFMLHLNTSPEQALFWNEVLVAALLWTLVSYYHFIRVYVKKAAGPGVYLGYGLVLALAILSLKGYVVLEAEVVDGVLVHDLGISLYLIGAVSLGFIGAVIFQLVKKYGNSIDPTDRNRVMYLITGWAIWVFLSYTNFIPALAGLPLDHIGGLVNALLVSYTISHFQLLDIRFVMRTGLGYLLVVVMVGGLYVGIVFLGQNVLPAQSTYVVVLLATLVVLLAVLLARPLRQTVQEGIDRLFYGDSYDYRRALLGFSSDVGNLINLEELAAKMLPTIVGALRITSARLMFQQYGGSTFATQFSHPTDLQPAGDGDLKLTLDNPVVTQLERQGQPLDLKQLDSLPQFKGLWQTEREKLASSGLEFLYPIKSLNKLIGILGLGKKKSGGLYSREDMHLIESMASQAGIIVDNARNYTQAVTWANTDGLTELYNHRQFHEWLNREISRSSRSGTPFSLIMLDLDHFKMFNDNYGHLAGDAVLRKVARCITSSIRNEDLAFRYGGEEFVVILPGTEPDDAYTVAERIRKAIEESGSISGIAPVSGSFGVSSWPLDGMAGEDIIRRADAALYKAKQSGRNRVCLASELPEGLTSPVSLEIKTRAEPSLSIIYALAATVDAKDHYTYGHSKKVSQYAVGISETLGLPPDRISTIRASGLLHDIGKLAIPDSVLNKPGPLTPEEWEPVKAHPQIGVEILTHVVDLMNCLPAILHHHEHYDGNGYPNGLRGKDIPLEARILAIADAYDALTSMRPYHNQLSPQQALDELRRCAGTQFDPDLVKVFCQSDLLAKVGSVEDLV
jgi:diguanylate cyclase (GGDEF)-like protein